MDGLPDMSDYDNRNLGARPSLPGVTGERRKEQDRRQTDRQGKYDRRKNRCSHCVHFESNLTEQGHCLLQNIPMEASAFACPEFEVRPAAP